MTTWAGRSSNIPRSRRDQRWKFLTVAAEYFPFNIVSNCIICSDKRGNGEHCGERLKEAPRRLRKREQGQWLKPDACGRRRGR